ncbi:hypothetical protein MASR2M78_21900 [Treponema sp.]
MRAKLLEAWEALQLESRVGKAGVLDLYLNLIPFGHNVEGFGAAARVYFGAPLDRLSRAQLMVLCVIPRAPARYDPATAPEAVRAAALKRLAKASATTPRKPPWPSTRRLRRCYAGQARRGPGPSEAPLLPGPSAGISGAFSRAWTSRQPFRSAIEAPLQSFLEDLLSRTVEEAKAKRVSNAAALFVRPSDMRISRLGRLGGLSTQMVRGRLTG